MVGNDAVRMFAGPSQPVEIHHRGIWYSGELIGWRHRSDGRVAARVRCRVDGLRHSAWTDLADLRLPDPKHPPRKEPFPAVVRLPSPTGGGDEEDVTRPHLLVAARPGRSAKPAHAVQPPATGDSAGSAQSSRAPMHSEPADAPRHQTVATVDPRLSLV